MATKIWSRKKLHVSADYNEVGELVISGQDLNGWNGRDEYEYWITVRPEDFATLRAALPGPADADLLELIVLHAEGIIRRGERTFLHDLGIEVGFHCWP